VLVELAEHLKADLLIVGNRGMTGVRRFMLGSVPNKVAHHAPCSVLIVDTGEK
jgi:nucleotide-binding universal stress UspA family protein